MADPERDAPVTVSVQLLGREFQIACPPGERDALLQSARLLDARMQEIRRAGKVLGTERITLMAALNLVHELATERDALRDGHDDAQARLDRLTERVTEALHTLRQRTLG
jgi:cell division protein ZapA